MSDALTFIEKKFALLSSLRARHGLRAETLVPDLAFIGLLDDTVDAAAAALELLNSARPHRAYSMMRAAFEAAQRLLVLGTADDYQSVGTQAWLYYQAKDTALRPTEHPESERVPSVESQVLRVWQQQNADAASIVDRERTALHARKRGRPDNFLGEDMAAAVHRAYVKLAEDRGTQVPEDSVEINRAVYRGLSRDSHACVRLEPQSMRIDSAGFVDVAERPRNKERIAEAVALGLESILGEAIAAVEYRLHHRQIAHTKRVAEQAAKVRPTVRADYKPDFGRMLLMSGVGHTTMTFPGVPLKHIRSLADGTLSCSVTTTVDSQEYIATFDFRGQGRDSLLSAIRSRFPGVLSDHDGEAQTLYLDLPEPIPCTLTALLGKLQENVDEAFAPLDVVELRVEPAE